MRINLFCNPFGHGGFAIHTQELVRELCCLGADIACFPTFPNWVRGNIDPIIRDSLLKSQTARPSAIGLKIDAPAPYAIATFSGVPRVFYTVLKLIASPEVPFKHLTT